MGEARGEPVGAKNQKLSRECSVLASKVRVSSFLVRGDPIKAGYAGVEVLGGCDWVKRERGSDGAKNQKPSREGLVWPSEVWVSSVLGRGDPIGVGYAGVGVVGGGY